jgi:hypothetical protein
LTIVVNRLPLLLIDVVINHLVRDGPRADGAVTPRPKMLTPKCNTSLRLKARDF